MQNPEPFRAHFFFYQQYIAVRIICRIPILHYKSCLLSIIKGTVPKSWHLKPPPRYGAESSSLMPHTQNQLIQVIRPCALQKPPSQMLLGQQPAQTAQRKRAWNANYVQAQSVGRVVSLDRLERVLHSLHCNSEGKIKQVISVPSTAQKLRDCKPKETYGWIFRLWSILMNSGLL